MRLVRFCVLSAALAIIASLAGCTTPAINDPARSGPFFQPKNVVHDPTLGGIRRVLLLPVWTGTLAPEETAAALDPIFSHALQEQHRFEVVTVSRDECRRRFGRPAFSSAEALPHDMLVKLRNDHAADAVMFVDITVYRAYHPLAIGVRSKLVAIANTRLVWTLDDLFAADNPDVAAGARHYYLNSEHQGVPGDLTPAVLQSPSRFAAYAADAVFATLPPVTLGR